MGAFDDIPVITGPLPGAAGGSKKGKAAPALPEISKNFEDLPSVPGQSPLARSYGQILADFALKGPFSEKFQHEIAPAIPEFAAFNTVTNAAVTAQEKGADGKAINRSAYEALPFMKAVEAAIKGYATGGVKGASQEVSNLSSLTEPIKAIPPRKLIVNVMKALNPDFQEPENPYAQVGLDLVGGLLTGAPLAAAHASAGALNEAEAGADALRAAEALKNNPGRKIRILGKGIGKQLEAAPKQLPAPKNIGEGFTVPSLDETQIPPQPIPLAQRKLFARLSEAMGKKSLPQPADLGEGFRIMPPELSEAILAAVRKNQLAEIEAGRAPQLPAPAAVKALPAPRNIGADFRVPALDESQIPALPDALLKSKTFSKYRDAFRLPENAPKLLEARGAGEDFQISSPADAKVRILNPLRKDAAKLSKQLAKVVNEEADALQDMASHVRGGEIVRPEGQQGGYRTSLPELLKHPETGNKPVSRSQFVELAERNLREGKSAAGVAEDFQELSAAQDIVQRRIRQTPLSQEPAKKGDLFGLDQKGQARIGKNYEGMSEEELRAEIDRLLNRKPPAGMKERKFINTVRKDDKTAPEVAATIKGDYEPITNKDTLAAADKLITENPAGALKLAHSEEPASALSNAVAIRLIDQFQTAGKYEEAIALVEKTAAKATKQGQAIQALSMYSRLSPEGVLRYTQNVLDRAKREIAGKADLTPEEVGKLPKSIQKKIADLKLTPEKIDQLKGLAKKIQESDSPRQRTINTARLMKAIADQLPVSIWKKISMVQTLAQLLNPKTAIRNTLGNAGFAALENVSDTVGAAFDAAVSTVTGQRSKVLPNVRVQFRGLQKGFREGMQDLEAGVKTSPAGTQYDLPAPGIFKSKVGQAFEKMLNFELQVPDRMAYTAAYRESLLNQLKAAKATKPTEGMLETAHLDALYRTFQDDNVVSHVFTGIKKALNAGGDFGLGDAVLKYPKTPANILARGIDYSPAGFIRTVVELGKGVLGEGFNQKAFVESGARAFVGSSLVGTGILLSRLGLITGHKKESSGVMDLKKLTGLGDYKINVSALKRFVLSGFQPDEAKLRKGDTLKTYDWFLPQAIDIAIGANIDENRGRPVGVVGTLADAIGSGTRTLAEQPLVAGLQRFFGYGDIVGGAAEILKGVPASFTPTLMRQIAMLVDDVRRNPDNKNPVKEAGNLVKMKIPGLSKSLPAGTDPFGDEFHYLRDAKSPGAKALAAFLDPAITTKYGTNPNTPAAEQLVKYDVPVTKQGDKLRGIELTDDEKAAIDATTGPLSKQLLTALINAPVYQALTDLQKQKALESAVRGAKNVAEVKNAPGIARRFALGKKAAA